MGSLDQSGSGYVKVHSEPSSSPVVHAHSLHSQQSIMSTLSSFHMCSTSEYCRIFEERPIVTIVNVSRADPGDISSMLLTYTIEVQYKQFKWTLLKKAAQVFYLHFNLKKRAFMEEIQERQEQVKEWLQNLGIGDHTQVVQNDEYVNGEDVPLNQEEGSRSRDVPSSAALPVMRPALGRQHSISERAKVVMQRYLDNFFENIEIVNSREVCKFLEVSKLSFCPEYGSKLKEDYVTVRHLPAISHRNQSRRCCTNCWLNCCSENWQKVWAVLKPGFLALLADPFDPKPLDIIVFDVLPGSNGNGEGRVSLAEEARERNPLRHAFRVTCGHQNIKFRVKDGSKVRDWVAAVNDAGLRPPEGWCHSHRFGSFAPPRGLTDDGSLAQWFVDGKEAFDAIASSIENARSEIFICGWWLCPELYLRRPFHLQASSRLDSLFEDKAKQGVQIYVLLYKEVALALKINSVYTKAKLLSIHENVKVLRYPDHFSSGVYLWSHHEKIVVVDHHVCYIGGLDLCFGRYDTNEHRVADQPPLVWPGKDYYNPRESEPNSWEDTMKDELDREKYPRMPWHDVHCALWGPPCRDIARHFVQRWNYAKRNKAPYEETIPLLMPQHHMVIPHYLGNATEIEFKNRSSKLASHAMMREDSFTSISSDQDIPLLLPHEPEELHNYNGGTGEHTWDLQSTKNPSFSLKRSKNEASLTDVPMKAFVDDNVSFMLPIATPSLLPSSTSECSEMESHNTLGGVYSADESAQIGPRTACRCQVIRSVSQWSAGTGQVEDSIHAAYCSLIETAEHFVYIENQFFISGLSGDEVIQNRVLEALFSRIMRAHKEKKSFRVIIVIPLLPGFQGGVDDGSAASVRAIMHWQYRTICRGPNSILHNLVDVLGSKTSNYISFYALRAHGSLLEGGSIATTQIYVHSKIMLVDDRAALIGSANINDRSLLGSRDSEIGVLIEDKEFHDSFMDGNPWKAGKFTQSLRLSLWSEHLDLRPAEVNKIIDPVIHSTYKDLWMATAKVNTMIYQDVFSCIPNDLIQTRAALRQSMAIWKEKLQHTTIDLGIAPQKSEINQNSDPTDRLRSVKGNLVSFPLDFMCKEDLRPVFNESEYYASQIFL